MKIAVLPIGMLLALVACGGGSSAPTSPAPAPQPAPAPAPGILSGILVDTVSGAPVAGASLAFAGGPVLTTSSDGRWEFAPAGTTALRDVVVTAAGLVTRQTAVRWEAAGRADVRLDAIADRAPFRLDFYRQFARDTRDQPDSPRALRRWTQAPNFSIDVTNPKDGERLTASEIDSVERVLRAAVPQLTGGAFQAGIIETGLGPVKAQTGYISVTFVSEPGADFCGWAYVGANPGEIVINYDRCYSGCGRFAPETLAHEVGHALGFFHTSSPGIMHPDRSRRCDNLEFSQEERVHAAIVYARPNGNRDTDEDPAGYAAVETAAPPVVVSCKG